MSLLSVLISVSFLFSIIRVTTPILFGSMSSMMSEQCGISNIAIEGMMLFSALIGVIASAYTGANVVVGVLAAVAVGILLALLLAFLIIKMKADAMITGVAFNLTASGATVFFLFLACGEKGISSSMISGAVPNINIPLINKIPYLGQVLSGHNLLTYLAFICVPVLSILLFKTTLGMHIRSAGENPDALSSVGVNSIKVQYIAMILSGLFAGLGGAYMSMAYVNYFVKDMVAGRGFIAIAAAALGKNKPVPTMFACILFGIADAFANNPSTQSLGIPTELVSGIPYVITVIALVIYSYRVVVQKRKALSNV